MGENFKKIRRKHILYAVLKSVVCGISLGLAAVGAVLLGVKLSNGELNAGWYVLIGVGVALALGGAAFAVFYPTRKKSAQRLDKSYALRERASTALEFEGNNGAIYELQREDAEKKLASLPVPRGGAAVKQAFIIAWKYALAAVLALALFITAASLPVKAQESDPKFQISEFQLIAVRELVQNVRSSNLDDELKDPAVATLEQLITDLQLADTQGKMERIVYTALDDVAAVLKPVGTYVQVSTALGKNKLTYLVRAVRRGVTVYKNYGFENYDEVKLFNADKENIVISVVTQHMENYRDTLGLSGIEGEAEFSVDTLESNILTITAAVANSGIDQTDPLYVAFIDFGNRLNTLKQQADNGLAGDELVAEAGIVFNAATSSISGALAQQAYVLAVNKHVDVFLRNTFNLPPAEEEKEFDDDYENPGGSVPDTPDSGDDSPGGGYGTGETIYGSDDLIYDPDSGEYVKYGELLNRYYAIMQEYLRSGTLTPEQETHIRAYFETLFSGFAED